MTKDEIIQLAKQADALLEEQYGLTMEEADELRDGYFANLIAAREREERDDLATAFAVEVQSLESRIAELETALLQISGSNEGVCSTTPLIHIALGALKKGKV
jgi:hypothetical protein